MMASFVILYAYGATGAQDGNPLAMWFIASTVAEGVFSLLGGFVCARLVRRNERRVTALLASLIAGTDLALAAILGEWEWLDGMLLALTVVCVLAGGEVGRRRNLANQREANAATAA